MQSLVSTEDILCEHGNTTLSQVTQPDVCGFLVTETSTTTKEVAMMRKKREKKD